MQLGALRTGATELFVRGRDDPEHGDSENEDYPPRQRRAIESNGSRSNNSSSSGDCSGRKTEDASNAADQKSEEQTTRKKKKDEERKAISRRGKKEKEAIRKRTIQERSREQNGIKRIQKKKRGEPVCLTIETESRRPASRSSVVCYQESRQPSSSGLYSLPCAPSRRPRGKARSSSSHPIWVSATAPPKAGQRSPNLFSFVPKRSWAFLPASYRLETGRYSQGM